MPHNIAKEVLKRLTSLEVKFTQHLIEGQKDTSDLQADMKWIKWFAMGSAGGIGAIVVALIIYALQK